MTTIAAAAVITGSVFLLFLVFSSEFVVLLRGVHAAPPLARSAASVATGATGASRRAGMVFSLVAGLGVELFVAYILIDRASELDAASSLILTTEVIAALVWCMYLLRYAFAAARSNSSPGPSGVGPERH